MKRCPSCQFVNQDQAKFCSQCGGAFAMGSATPSHAPSPPSAPSVGVMPSSAPIPPAYSTQRPLRWPWVVAALALLICGAFAFSKTGILRLPGSPVASGVTRAEGATDAGITRISTKPEAGVTKSVGTAPPVDTPMPNDVKDYLEHVRKTEERRHDISNRQLSSAMTLFIKLQGLGTIDPSAMMSDDPNAEIKPPTDDLAVETAKMRAEWKELSRFFLSKRPPSECAALQSHYDTAVGETSSQILDLMDVLSHPDADPQAMIAKLNAKKGQSKVIDEQGKASNDEVVAICERYKTKPWFEISADIGGSGGILKSLGL